MDVTKSQVNKIAQLRRGGATWDEVIAETGVKTNSTGFRILLEEAGFDKLGVKKGSSQKSEARAWGSATGKLRGRSNGTGSKSKARKAAKSATKGKAKTRKPAAKGGKRKVKKPARARSGSGDPF